MINISNSQAEQNISHPQDQEGNNQKLRIFSGKIDFDRKIYNFIWAPMKRISEIKNELNKIFRALLVLNIQDLFENVAFSIIFIEIVRPAFY